jgi:hypothetical protein
MRTSVEVWAGMRHEAVSMVARLKAMPKAALYGVYTGSLALAAFSSVSAAQGTSNASPQCPAPSHGQGSPAQIGGLWRAELPWLAAGMRPEEAARFLQSCGTVEGAGEPTPAARQPTEGPRAVR